jgi:serine protease Do
MSTIMIGLPNCAADDPAGQSVQADQTRIHARALSTAFRLAARKATPSVVTVYTYGQDANLPTDAPNPGPREGDPAQSPENRLTGLGSGVIVSDSGMVITNNHVITGAKRVVIHLPDDTQYEANRVVGDPDSDIAMLQVESDEPLPGAEIGDSDALEIGDWVLAIGSPFRLEATVSAGIISAKHRQLERIRRGRLLQTDAAINPGNSGGPLIDLDGKVIAISTAIATRNGGYQGIGFAIPINQAKWVADELAKHGRVRRSAMGTTLADLKPSIAKKFNLPPNSGVLVYQIIEDSAADRAGFQQLDVIIEFAGKQVRSSNSLQEVIEREPIGSLQEVKVLRGGKEVMLKVELAPLDDPTEVEQEQEQETDQKDEEQDEQESENQTEAGKP